MKLVTKSGKVLTEKDIERFAKEAERGYDVDKLLSQPPRKQPRVAQPG